MAVVKVRSIINGERVTGYVDLNEARSVCSFNAGNLCNTANSVAPCNLSETGCRNGDPFVDLTPIIRPDSNPPQSSQPPANKH